MKFSQSLPSVHELKKMSNALAVRAVELKNNPAPDSRQINSVRRALAEIGGIIPHGFGAFSQKPSLTLLWGQTERAFDAGRERIRFFDQQIDPVYSVKKFRLSSFGLEQLSKFERVRNHKMQEAFAKQDWEVYHACLFAPMEYFLKKFVPRKDWEYLPDTASLQETARLLPDGWHYFEDLPTVQEIGCANFYVAQWVSPDGIDKRDNWENNRYGLHPVMEFYGREHFVDIIGEYPKFGAYWNVLFKIETDAGGYLEPSETNTVERVRKIMAEARRRTKQASKTAYRVEKRAENENRKIQLASRARFNKFQERSRKNVFVYGNTARIVVPEKNKWGKPTETILFDAKGNKIQTDKKGEK